MPIEVLVLPTSMTSSMRHPLLDRSARYDVDHPPVTPTRPQDAVLSDVDPYPIGAVGQPHRLTGQRGSLEPGGPQRGETVGLPDVVPAGDLLEDRGQHDVGLGGMA